MVQFALEVVWGQDVVDAQERVVPAAEAFTFGATAASSAARRKRRSGAPYPPATLEIRVRNYAPDRWRARR